MQRRWRLVGFFLIGLAVLLAGCGEAPLMPPVTRVPAVTPPAVQQALPQLTTGGTLLSPVEPAARPQPSGDTVWRPREIAANVQAALARSLDVPVEEVPLLRFEPQVDPQNLACLDQLVGVTPFGEGEALVFQYQDAIIYAVSSRGTVWICREAVAARGVSLSLDEATDVAVQDLARRLGVDATAVQVVAARAVEWPDASLGCPEPDKAYAQVVTPGYEIVLQVQDTRYVYRGSRSQVFLCESETEGP